MCQEKNRNVLQLLSAPVEGDTLPVLASRSTLISTAVSALNARKDAHKGGSRRRRLWDLSDHAHCPVVGVCLPMAHVRRLVIKVHGPNRQGLDDYDCHCTAVTESKQRTPLAELIQRELDQRCALAIREAAHIKCEDELVCWWRAKVDGPDLARAFWVTLTHPCCSDAVEYKVLGHVHMLQHQVGTLCRVERTQFESLLKENEILGRHLASVQDRVTHLTREGATRAEALERDVLRLRAELMSRDTEIASLKEQVAAWQARDPDLPTRKALARRQGDLMSENQALRKDALKQAEEIARLQARVHQLSNQPELTDIELSIEPVAPTQVDLNNRAILCVGGRPAIVPIYRDLIEQEGGRFLHHDGGEENSSSQLDATLAAADLVICQTGCVSHNAYWRVKDHCKRTGKQCVFVDTPSRSALSRALTDVAQALVQQAEHHPAPGRSAHETQRE